MEQQTDELVLSYRRHNASHRMRHVIEEGAMNQHLVMCHCSSTFFPLLFYRSLGVPTYDQKRS